MQPGPPVAALDSLDHGRRWSPTGTKLAIAPGELLTQYAASLAYPKPATAPAVDADDPFATSVRPTPRRRPSPSASSRR